VSASIDPYFSGFFVLQSPRKNAVGVEEGYVQKHRLLFPV